MTAKTYWAIEKDPKVLGKSLIENVERFERYVRESGLYSLWAAMHRHYHGIDRDGFTSHEISNKGEEGELAVFNQNHLRELLTHYRTLAQGQRAALEPLATDEDYESEMQKIRAKGVIENADRKARLEEIRNDAIEYAGVYGVGWMRQAWHDKIGELVMPDNPESLINDSGPSMLQSPRIHEPGSDTGLNEDATSLQAAPAPHPDTIDSAVEHALTPGDGDPSLFGDQAQNDPGGPHRKGELKADAFTPSNVIYDLARVDGNHDWWLLRAKRNRWDLAVEFPASREKILGITDPDPMRPTSIDLRFETFNTMFLSKGLRDDDQIVCWEFWHKRTQACPNGRLAYMLSDGTVLEVQDLGKYREVAIRPVFPGKIIGTPFYYTPGFDLLSPQEAMNMLQSIALTNQRAHGVGIILMPQGSNLVAEEVGTGLAVCEYIGGLGEPKAMNFTSTPAEVFKNMDQIQSSMQKNIGVNGTIRGDPEANLKSGSALIFVQSQAVQFASSFQQTIIGFYEHTASDTIWIHQDFMTEEQLFEILGVQEAIDTMAFSGKDISRIVRVRVEVVNPLMNTLAGRQQVIEGAVKMYGPEVIPPANYFRTLVTGRWEPAMRDQEKKLSNAKQMCQLMAQGVGLCPRQPQIGPDGQPVMGPDGAPLTIPAGEPGKKYVRPLVSDDHRYMVKHALTVLDSPAARSNEAVVKAVTEVVQMHKAMLAHLTIADPGMLEITGQMPLQSAMIGMGGQTPGGAPPDASAGGPAPSSPGATAHGPPGPGGPPPPGLPPPSQALKPGIDNAPPGPGQPPRMPQMPRSPLNGKREGEPNLIGQRQ